MRHFARLRRRLPSPTCRYRASLAGRVGTQRVPGGDVGGGRAPDASRFPPACAAGVWLILCSGNQLQLHRIRH